MPRKRTVYGSAAHLEHLRSKVQATLLAWKGAVAGLSTAERSMQFQPKDSVVFSKKGCTFTGKVGDVRTLEDGSVEYFVYVPNPDGFGTTTHVVHCGSVVVPEAPVPAYVAVPFEAEPAVEDHGDSRAQEPIVMEAFSVQRE